MNHNIFPFPGITPPFMTLNPYMMSFIGAPKFPMPGMPLYMPPFGTCPPSSDVLKFLEEQKKTIVQSMNHLATMKETQIKTEKKIKMEEHPIHIKLESTNPSPVPEPVEIKVKEKVKKAPPQKKKNTQYKKYKKMKEVKKELRELNIKIDEPIESIEGDLRKSSRKIKKVTDFFHQDNLPDDEKDIIFIEFMKSVNDIVGDFEMNMSKVKMVLVKNKWKLPPAILTIKKNRIFYQKYFAIEKTPVQNSETKELEASGLEKENNIQPQIS